MKNKKRNHNLIAITLIACAGFFGACGNSQAMDGLGIGAAAGGGIGYIIGNELDKIDIWDAMR